MLHELATPDALDQMTWLSFFQYYQTYQTELKRRADELEKLKMK